MSYNQERFIKFLKSCFWNFGVYVLLFSLDFISSRLTGFKADPYVLGLISILISRLTKVINVQLQARKELE